MDNLVNTKSIKAIIIGRGSIGKRHEKILNLFCENVISLSSKEFLKTKDDLKKIILIPEKTIVFICSATKFHMETLNRLKFHKLNIFIEKPIIYKNSEINFFRNFVKKYKLKIFNGYMLRHDPRIILLKKIVTKNINEVKYAKFNLQTNMPTWHPNEDFRKNYANNKKLGGGVLLTCGHEIDLSIMFFGPPKKVFCIQNKSKLKNDVENSIIIIMFHSNKIRSEITLDFENDYTKKRYIEIYSKNSLLRWDFYKNFLTEEKKYELKKIFSTKNSNIDNIYIYQINNILKSINKNKGNKRENLYAEKVIFAAKKSIFSQKVEIV